MSKPNEPTKPAPLTAERIAELKAKHGAHLTAVEGMSAWLIFRKPTRHEYDRYTDKVYADRSQTRAAAWELAQACIVEPGPQALTDAMDHEPAILLSHIAPAIHAMAGDEREPQRVKL
jgi:hypothetical protein